MSQDTVGLGLPWKLYTAAMPLPRPLLLRCVACCSILPPLCAHSAPCWCCCLELDDNHSKCPVFHYVPGPENNAATLRWSLTIALMSFPFAPAHPMAFRDAFYVFNPCLLISVHLSQSWRVFVLSKFGFCHCLRSWTVSYRTWALSDFLLRSQCVVINISGLPWRRL